MRSYALTARAPLNPNPPLSRAPQGATEPPPRLSERDLISKMESYGIGTDATVAEHIQKQLERGYAVKDEGALTFWPTPLGEQLSFHCPFLLPFLLCQLFRMFWILNWEALLQT